MAAAPPNDPKLAQELRKRLDWPDEKLLAECQIDTYRASGPGGQHRNKVSSAIRLHHRPGGLVVTGTGSRSQHENKRAALTRLREALAISFRAPLAAAPAWPENVHIEEGRLRVSDRNPSLYHVLGLVLDAVAAHAGRLPEAAAALGLSASSLSRFLASHPKAFVEANRIRQEHGLPRLSA